MSTSQEVPLKDCLSGEKDTHKKACLTRSPGNGSAGWSARCGFGVQTCSEAFPMPCLGHVSSSFSNPCSPDVSPTKCLPSHSSCCCGYSGILKPFIWSKDLPIPCLSPIPCFLKSVLSLHRTQILISRMMLSCDAFMPSTITTCMPLLICYWTKLFIRIWNSDRKRPRQRKYKLACTTPAKKNPVGAFLLIGQEFWEPSLCLLACHDKHSTHIMYILSYEKLLRHMAILWTSPCDSWCQIRYLMWDVCL